MPSKPDLETWETTTASVHSINRYNARGDVTGKAFGGRSGMKVQLTADERVDLNEDLAADDTVCIFRNGFLRPVRGVPDDIVERFETVTKQHGGMSTEELINALDTLDGPEFGRYVGRLNQATLIRFQELAKAADARASQVEAIDERLATMRPRIRETETEKLLRRDPTMGGASTDPAGEGAGAPQ
jgi:hypothetical protein